MDKKLNDCQVHLKQIVGMFYKAKESFKAQAFNKVATQLGRYDKLDFVNGKLQNKIPGVGEAIRDVIEQFYASGTSEKFKKLVKLVGVPEVFERHDRVMVEKSVRKLFKQLTDLNIDWDFAGSYRRGSKSVKDIDIVVCKRDGGERVLIERLLLAAGLQTKVRNGNEKLGVNLKLPNGRFITMDINFCTPADKGAMYLYLTGPASYNIDMRTLAKKNGMTLNQHGLYKGKKLLAADTEERIYSKLGLVWERPEKRF